MLGTYLRGQIILGLADGLMSLAGLRVLRMLNALPLAVIAGLLEFVPFVGPVAAAVPAILTSFTVSPVVALLVALFYLLVQQFEGNYLVLKVMSKQTSLHSLLVLIAIFAGFQLGGIIQCLNLVDSDLHYDFLVHFPSSFFS